MITQADSTLNLKVMTSVGYLPSQETNVAEHELGHAIGLYHSPIKQSVMFAANRFYTIQPADIASVRNLYATSLDATASLTQNTLFQHPFACQVHSPIRVSLTHLSGHSKNEFPKIETRFFAERL